MAYACKHTWLSGSSAQKTLSCAVQWLEFSLWKPRAAMDRLARAREKCWKNQHKGCSTTHGHACAILLLGKKEGLHFPNPLLIPSCLLSLRKVVPALGHLQIWGRQGQSLLLPLQGVSHSCSGGAGRRMHTQTRSLSPSSDSTAKEVFRVLLPPSKMVIILGQGVEEFHFWKPVGHLSTTGRSCIYTHSDIIHYQCKQ